MKQEINLYQVGKERVRFTFNFRQSIRFLGFYALVLVLISSYDAYSFFMSRHELKTLTAQEAEFNEKLKLTQGKIPTKQTREEALSEIETLQATKAEKQNTLDSLIDFQRKRVGGFSRYFVALANEAVPGVWVTDFTLLGDGSYVLIEGRSLRPEYVPKFMEGLSKEAVFAGKTFQIFKLSVDEATNQVVFKLETGEGTKGEGTKKNESAAK